VKGTTKPLVAIACGGTGGHLFPGLAVGEELLRLGCRVQLLISPKEVDQQAVRYALGMETVVLPAIGLTRGKVLRFAKGFLDSYRAAKAAFRKAPPQAVLAMGGFTSAPPVLAGRSFGAVTFLHESNTIPGKANRWLAHFVTQAFVGFPQAANRLFLQNIATTGTPVRPQFQAVDAAACRMALGLKMEDPVLLVMGGSQGASGINQMVLQAAPNLLEAIPALQFLHLTGPSDFEKVKQAYESFAPKAVVKPFLSEMEFALGASTLAISRAGASSLAEMAAMRLPAILIPYPAAADNHQYFNARAFADSGAAVVFEQGKGGATELAALAGSLLADPGRQSQMRQALVRWHSPDAAEMIAEKILYWMGLMGKHQPETRSSGGTRSGEFGNPKSVLA
jgi:UDP-N-acetylglucosamine--N-acetylmuramyl-(pentapeptide) pyrophosphoryl-undecaprenol N-acetylglucosamine transferase